MRGGARWIDGTSRMVMVGGGVWRGKYETIPFHGVFVRGSGGRAQPKFGDASESGHVRH